MSEGGKKAIEANDTVVSATEARAMKNASATASTFWAEDCGSRDSLAEDEALLPLIRDIIDDYLTYGYR